MRISSRQFLTEFAAQSVSQNGCGNAGFALQKCMNAPVSEGKMDIEFYTIKEVSKLLNLSKQTILNRIKDGRLKAVRFGDWRILKSDLLQAIDKERNTPRGERL